MPSSHPIKYKHPPNNLLSTTKHGSNHLIMNQLDTTPYACSRLDPSQGRS